MNKVIGFKPIWDFKSGLQKFLEWVLLQNDIPLTTNDYKKSLEELKSKGLLN